MKTSQRKREKETQWWGLFNGVIHFFRSIIYYQMKLEAQLLCFWQNAELWGSTCIFCQTNLLNWNLCRENLKCTRWTVSFSILYVYVKWIDSQHYHWTSTWAKKPDTNQCGSACTIHVGHKNQTKLYCEFNLHSEVENKSWCPRVTCLCWLRTIRPCPIFLSIEPGEGKTETWDS